MYAPNHITSLEIVVMTPVSLGGLGGGILTNHWIVIANGGF